MSDQFRDVISVYRAKEVEVREQLKQTLLFWINAPDEEEDRQGYLFLSSPLKHKTDRYSLFRYFVIGARSADMRDVEELLALGDSEARTEYSEEGDDFHAIVGARMLSEYFKLILRSGDEPIGLAVETVLRDDSGELIVVHFDGEYERIQLDRKCWVRYLGGSKDPEFIRKVERRAAQHIRTARFHPDQTDGFRDALRALVPEGYDVERWRLNNMVADDPTPESLTD